MELNTPLLKSSYCSDGLRQALDWLKLWVEYSLDLDIPDVVYENPTIRAMLDAISDIITWPNDICSCNKEQADNDYQNLVFVLMVERRIGLQEAVDLLTSMVADRVQDYNRLKRSLPTFGKDVDRVVAIYLKNLEHLTQALSHGATSVLAIFVTLMFPIKDTSLPPFAWSKFGLRSL